MSLSVSVSSVTTSSFTARVSASGAVAMQHNWYLDGNLYETVQTAAGVTSSSCSFTGLSAGTTYRVSVRVYAFNPWRELDNGAATVTTKSSGGGSSGSGDGDDSKTRPRDWYWSSNVQKGSPLSLPAREWNQFIERIEAFADYKGVRLSSRYLSDALVSSGTRMLATQGRAACYLIDQLNPSIDTPYPVSSGDPITAAFFLGLRSALNSVR